jgi:hypothetical protein
MNTQNEAMNEEVAKAISTPEGRQRLASSMIAPIRGTVRQPIWENPLECPVCKSVCPWSKRECDCGTFWDAECSGWVKPGDVVMTDETSSG